MTARRIVRSCKLQHPPGRFIEFTRGQVLSSDHPHIDHWFVRENSMAVESPAAEEPADELVRDAELAGEGVTKESLLSHAKEIGLEVDGRWGLARLQSAIDAAASKG